MDCFTDVDLEKPDERSIVTYLATLYDKLEADRDKSPKEPHRRLKPHQKNPHHLKKAVVELLVLSLGTSLHN